MKPKQSKEAEEKAIRDAVARFNLCTPFSILEPTKKRTWPEPRKRIWNREDSEGRIQAGEFYLNDLLERSLNEADPIAIDFLFRMAFRCVDWLDELARQRPELLCPLARQNIKWPAFVGKKALLERYNKALVTKIQLGEDCLLKGNWNPESPATLTAKAMRCWLEDNWEVLKLPALSRETVNLWFEVGWRALLDVMGGHPANNEILQDIGKHRGEHSKHEGAQKRVTPRTRETNIKDGIKKQVRQSFMRLSGFPLN